MEKIINLDKQLLVYLNSLGSTNFDAFWLFITDQRNWIPFFLLLIYLVYKKLGTKQTLYILLTVAILVVITDQTSNLFKNYFQRLRPCNTEDLKGIIRVIKSSETYSFFSGHAANTSAVAMFLFLILKKQYKSFWLIFLWPLIFAYSRIYLGLHFPIDILTGYFFGLVYGFLAFKIYCFFNGKYQF
jgi:undecaprenyl-diphosphatase